MWACHNARFDPSHSPTNADMDGIAVAIVSESCPRRTWSPEDIDAGIQASFLRIYSIFLSTLFSVGRQQLSLFDANFALTVSTSPLTVYLSAASCCDLLGIKTGLYKRIKSHRPVTRVLGAQIPLLSFVLSMIITLSDRALIDSQACKGSTFVTWGVGTFPLLPGLLHRTQISIPTFLYFPNTLRNFRWPEDCPTWYQRFGLARVDGQNYGGGFPPHGCSVDNGGQP